MNRPGLQRGRRRLVVNADDFGRSTSINQAVIRAHREGILTTASLMVNEAAWEEAVELARSESQLGIGLHLSLVCGRAALSEERIPGLVREGRFTNNPVAAGWKYFAQPALRAQLRAEIHEQFRRFHATGLAMDHVNGHLHMHLHPTVFRILMADADALGIKRLRLTRDPLRLNMGLARGRWGYRLSHWFIYAILSLRARRSLDERGINHTDTVIGLLQNGLVDERFVSGLMNKLPPGDSELYSHPSLDEFSNEFEALVSPSVAAGVKSAGIQLIRYQDL